MAVGSTLGTRPSLTGEMDSQDIWSTHRSTHIDILACGPESSDADAAAGGCRPADVIRHSPRRAKPTVATSSKGGGSSAVILPVEPTCGGSIASAGAVQLQKEIGDAVALHRSAMAAVDRISKQQAALRRFPVVCPTCDTLNAPDGGAWSAGDLCACKGCNRTFVPLGQGCLQDSDLNVLRLALQQLLVYTDRVQTLEQQLLVKQPLGPRPASKSVGATLEHESHERLSMKGRVPALRLPLRPPQESQLSPCQEHLMSPRAKPVFSAEDPSEIGADAASTTAAAAQQPPRLPLAPTIAAGEAAAVAAVSGVERRTLSPRDGTAPRLMSFMDTQDLMSSKGSICSTTPSLTTIDFLCPGKKKKPCAEKIGRPGLEQAASHQAVRLPLSATPGAHRAVGATAATPAGGAISASGESKTLAPGDRLAPKLIGFMDTHDLMSSRGSTSSVSPPTLMLDFSRPGKGGAGAGDTPRQTLEQAKQDLAFSKTQPPWANARCCGAPAGARKRWPLEREDGEVTSSCESEGWDSHHLRRGYGALPRKGQHLKLAAAAEAASRRLDAHKRRKSRGGDSAECSPSRARAQEQLSFHDSKLGAAGYTAERRRSGCGPWTKAGMHLAVLFGVCYMVRCFVLSLLSSLLPDHNLGSSLLAAMASAGAACLFRAAERTLEACLMFETAQLNWNCHKVRLKISGPTWTLFEYDVSMEEAFGLSVVLIQVAALFFFESWGIHGPPSLQRAAVGLHACFAAVLTAVAHNKFTQGLGLPSSVSYPHAGRSDSASPSSAVSWLTLAVGNAVTASWAAATWWHTTSLPDGMGPADTLVATVVARMPVAAMAAVNMANFWLARRVHQPELLAGCVAFSAISMAIGCWGGGGGPAASGDADLALGHLPCFYAAFCFFGATCLLQELLHDL